MMAFFSVSSICVLLFAYSIISSVSCSDVAILDAVGLIIARQVAIRNITPATPIICLIFIVSYLIFLDLFLVIATAKPMRPRRPTPPAM